MIEGTNLFLNLFFQALSTTQRSQQNQKQTQALHVRQYSITSERAKRGRASPVENREKTEARESSGTVSELLSAPCQAGAFVASSRESMHSPGLVSSLRNSMTFADGACGGRSRSEEEAMQGHRRRRETQRSPATSISPKGGGGTTSILLSLLLHDVH